MPLSTDFIEELHSRNDIADVISSYVPLTRQGSRHKALCPFHNEKTASFTVFNDTQSFYCFGCGAGGDIISFVMKQDNLAYMEAVKLLADRAGMSMPEETADYDDSLRRRKRLYEINKSAARFFFETLNSDDGRNARAYLRGRGLDDSVIKKFGLGYSSERWDSLRTSLRDKGYSDREMLAAGLLSEGKRGTYDAFRGRIMFPIIDLQGRVIAFGGRTLGSGPKYINSPETEIFKKGRNLFALNIAKNNPGSAKSGPGKMLILTEGYMDVIALHKAGFQSAVATLGTALSAQQARLLYDYAKEITIAYDSDEAGRKATMRAANILRETELTVSVLSYEGAKDPDEFIRRFGAERFKMLLSGSDDVIRYELTSAKEKYPLSVPEGINGYIREAAVVLAGVGSKAERESYASWLSDELQGKVSKEAILADIDKIKAGNNRKQKRERDKKMMDVPGFYGIPGTKRREIGSIISEEALLAILLKNPDMLKDLDRELDGEDLFSEQTSRIYSTLREFIIGDSFSSFTSLTGAVSEAQMSELAKIDARYKNENFSKADVYYHIKVLKEAKRKIGKEEIKGMDPGEIQKRLSQ